MNVDLSEIGKVTNDKYYPKLFAKERYLVFVGSAGSGKSEFCAEKVLFRILSEPGLRLLCARKVARTIKNSSFRLLCDWISRHEWDSLFSINKTDLTIKCRYNGSEILFVGLDDVEKLKSIVEPTSGWIEEATEITEEEFIQFDLRIRGRGHYKQIMLSFNPVNINHWLNDRFFITGDSDANVLHTTYKDNRFIDSQYAGVLESLKDKNESMYNIYALGLWGVLEGLIYEPMALYDESKITFDEVIYGLDFGFNNPTALYKIGFKDNNPYYKELIYESGLITSDLINKLEELGVNKDDYIYGDSSEPDRIEEIERDGYNIHPARKGKGSVVAGINHLKGLTQHTLTENTHLNSEFAGYVWETKKGKALDVPVKLNDHGCDAVRYGVYTHQTRSITSIGSINLGMD